MSVYDLITLSSDCSFVTKSIEKNCVIPKSRRTFRTRFRGLLIAQHIRNAFVPHNARL